MSAPMVYGGKINSMLEASFDSWVGDVAHVTFPTLPNVHKIVTHMLVLLLMGVRNDDRQGHNCLQLYPLAAQDILSKS